MGAFITCFVVCIILCIFGMNNMKGDISSLHDYHRKNVKPEDVKPFGRQVGLGTIITGVSVAVMGAFTYLAVLTNTEAFTVVGMVLMFVGLIVGMGMAFYAMKKYNGGIFG